MVGDEDLRHREVVAAGRSHAVDVPHVVHLDRLDRHEKPPHVGPLGAVDEHGPHREVAVADAAGVAPAPADEEAALDRHRPAGRERGTGRHHVRLRPEHLVLGALREQRQDQVVLHEERRHPRGGRVGLAEWQDDLDEVDDAELQPAVAAGHEVAEHTAGVDGGEHLVVEAALLLGISRPRRHQRLQCHHAVDQVGRGQRPIRRHRRHGSGVRSWAGDGGGGRRRRCRDGAGRRGLRPLRRRRHPRPPVDGGARADGRRRQPPGGGRVGPARGHDRDDARQPAGEQGVVRPRPPAGGRRAAVHRAGLGGRRRDGLRGRRSRRAAGIGGARPRPCPPLRRRRAGDEGARRRRAGPRAERADRRGHGDARRGDGAGVRAGAQLDGRFGVGVLVLHRVLPRRRLRAGRRVGRAAASPRVDRPDRRRAGVPVEPLRRRARHPARRARSLGRRRGAVAPLDRGVPVR